MFITRRTRVRYHYMRLDDERGRCSPALVHLLFNAQQNASHFESDIYHFDCCSESRYDFAFGFRVIIKPRYVINTTNVRGVGGGGGRFNMMMTFSDSNCEYIYNHFTHHVCAV